MGSPVGGRGSVVGRTSEKFRVEESGGDGWQVVVME